MFCTSYLPVNSLPGQCCFISDSHASCTAMYTTHSADKDKDAVSTRTFFRQTWTPQPDSSAQKAPYASSHGIWPKTYAICEEKKHSSNKKTNAGMGYPNDGSILTIVYRRRVIYINGSYRLLLISESDNSTAGIYSYIIKNWYHLFLLIHIQKSYV